MLVYAEWRSRFGRFMFLLQCITNTNKNTKKYTNVACFGWFIWTHSFTTALHELRTLKHKHASEREYTLNEEWRIKHSTVRLYVKNVDKEWTIVYTFYTHWPTIVWSVHFVSPGRIYHRSPREVSPTIQKSHSEGGRNFFPQPSSEAPFEVPSVLNQLWSPFFSL